MLASRWDDLVGVSSGKSFLFLRTIKLVNSVVGIGLLVLFQFVRLNVEEMGLVKLSYHRFESKANLLLVI